MNMARIRRDQSGRIPIPLIIVFVVIIGGAVFAFLAYSGVIYIPGITPEEEEEAAPEKIEITVEQQLSQQIIALNRIKIDNLDDISKLEELVELKDERIAGLQAEIARLEGLVQLSDEGAVRDAAAVFEAMTPEVAAEILGKYDPEKAVLLLKAMEEKDAAAVLELMDPDIASQITQMMAGFIQPFLKPGGETPAPATQPATQPSASAGGPSASGGG